MNQNSFNVIIYCKVVFFFFFLCIFFHEKIFSFYACFLFISVFPFLYKNYNWRQLVYPKWAPVNVKSWIEFSMFREIWIGSMLIPIIERNIFTVVHFGPLFSIQKIYTVKRSILTWKTLWKAFNEARQCLSNDKRMVRIVKHWC